jgi:hypothetical protein
MEAAALRRRIGQLCRDLPQVMQRGAMARLEPASLCGSESLSGNLERGELLERLAHPGELALQMQGQRAEEGGAAQRSANGAQRIAQQLLLLAIALARLIGAHQREKLGVLEGMALGAMSQSSLLLGPQGTKSLGCRKSELSRIDLGGQLRIEPLGQQPPRGDPALLAPEQGRRCRKAQMVLLPK